MVTIGISATANEKFISVDRYTWNLGCSLTCHLSSFVLLLSANCE